MLVRVDTVNVSVATPERDVVRVVVTDTGGAGTGFVFHFPMTTGALVVTCCVVTDTVEGKVETALDGDRDNNLAHRSGVEVDTAGHGNQGLHLSWRTRGHPRRLQLRIHRGRAGQVDALHPRVRRRHRGRGGNDRGERAQIRPRRTVRGLLNLHHHRGGSAGGDGQDVQDRRPTHCGGTTGEGVVVDRT